MTAQQSQSPVNRDAALTGGFFAAVFMAMGAHLPFWPIWLADWGLSAQEIGNYAAIGIVARMVGGVGAPMVADRLGAQRAGLTLLAIASAIAFALHAWVETRTAIWIGAVATAGLTAGLIPMGEAMGYAAAERRGFDYARIRSAGSVAFIFANLVCGWWVASAGSDLALWWIAACFVAVAVTGWLHPGGGASGDRPSLAEAALLAGSPRFVMFMAAHALMMASHGVYYAYGSIHWRAQGIGEGVIGMLWGVGVAAEVLLMLFAGGWLIRRFGPVGAMMLGASLGCLRWLAMCFDPSLAWLWPLQALHAFSFAAVHLGSMAFIAAAAPTRLRATAQGLTGAGAGGAALAGVSVAAASIYGQAGGMTYALAAGVSTLGLAIAWRLGRRWSGERLAPFRSGD